MGLCGETVRHWLKRFKARGFDGLEEEVRSGRPPTYTAAESSAVIDTALTPLLADLLDKIPDPDAKAKAAASANAQLVALLQAGDSAQLAVNAAEAANPNLFVSGGRPAGPDGRLPADGLGAVDLVAGHSDAGHRHRHADGAAGAAAGLGSLPEL